MRLRMLSALATALLLLVGACGHQPRDPEPAQRSVDLRLDSGRALDESDHRAVEWADQYCAAVVGLVEAISIAPQVDPSSPQRASETSIDMLAGVIDGLDGTVRRLDALEPSPVAGGDDVAGTAIGNFLGIRNRAVEAQYELSAAPAGTAQGHRALDITSAVLQEVADIDLLSGVQAIPELAASSRQAPACDQLNVPEPSPRTGSVPGTAEADVY